MTLDSLRSLSRLRWWIVVWCVLSLGAALASPIVQPHTVELICSGGSGATLVVHGENGPAPFDGPGADCAVCLLGAAPPLRPLQIAAPLPATAATPAPPPVALALPPTAAPPPARAPPFSVC